MTFIGPVDAPRGAYAKSSAIGQATKRNHVSIYFSYESSLHLRKQFAIGVHVSFEQKIPKVAAVDYGLARIGVALSDDLGIIAHPRPFVPGRPPKRALRLLSQILKNEGVSLILIGLPRNMNGSEGPSFRKASEFGQALGAISGITVEGIDERLSTVQAQALLHAAGESIKSSRSKIDSASAAVLLQSWLDTRS